MKKEKNYPTNILLLTTHGSYHIPFWIRPFLSREMKKNDTRLLKNFSDYATQYLIPKDFPKEQQVICTFSRALGDPNRSPKDKECFRTEDFNGNKIWIVNIRKIIKKILLKNYSHKYHKEIDVKIKKLLEKEKELFIFDIHDTGNLMLKANPNEDTERKETFPKLCISNLDNRSSSKELIQELKKKLEKEFKVKVEVNTPYKGGYITQRLSKKKNIQTIQIELNRSLYMNEKTQIINEEKMKKTREQLIKAIIETSSFSQSSL